MEFPVSKPVKIAATSFLVSVALLAVVRQWLKRRERDRPSGRWREVGRVSELYIYPIKSCAGISLNQGLLTSIGMEEVPRPGYYPLGDRKMVVYKEDPLEMVSARTYTQMLQVRVNSDSERDITIKYREQKLRVQLPDSSPNRTIRLWTEQVALIDCGDEVASWLQAVVFNGKEGFRLGCWPSSSKCRNIKMSNDQYPIVYPYIKDEFSGAFSDLSSFLLLNESSVVDLNKEISKRRIEQKNDTDASGSKSDDETSAVTPTNFRGNIIVEGPSAYEEDEWNWIKIGDGSILRNFMPCTRCTLTTVNPVTSERDKHLEPLSTLKTYRLLDERRRKVSPSPAMGIYLGLCSSSGGLISVGDPVYVCD